MRRNSDKRKGAAKRRMLLPLATLAVFVAGCADKSAPVAPEIPRPPEYCYRVDRTLTEAMAGNDRSLITDETRENALVCTRRYIVVWECANAPDGERCLLAKASGN